MPHFQYACPDCGLTGQSAEDLSGKEVTCLGCQAVFVAASLKAASWGKPAEIVAKPAVSSTPASSAARSRRRLRPQSLHARPPPAVVKSEPAPPPVVRRHPRRYRPCNGAAAYRDRRPADLPAEPEESSEPEGMSTCRRFPAAVGSRSVWPSSGRLGHRSRRGGHPDRQVQEQQD